VAMYQDALQEWATCSCSSLAAFLEKCSSSLF